MVFGPKGERGLGFTSRAGRWGLGSIPEYLARGDSQCLRMVQLEDWATLDESDAFAALEHVNGIFIGHGDLFLSSGKPPSSPDVKQLTAWMLQAAKNAQSAVGCGRGNGRPKPGPTSIWASRSSWSATTPHYSAARLLRQSGRRWAQGVSSRHSRHATMASITRLVSCGSLTWMERVPAACAGRSLPPGNNASPTKIIS